MQVAANDLLLMLQKTSGGILVNEMYSPPSSGTKQTIKQIAIYALMTATVIVGVLVLMFIMLGYRFDRTAGTIEQGGLVQLNSIPSGASLTIDAARLSATTSTKTTLAPGQHAITMSRSGYLAWQKTVDVIGGTILWLNYARLIPNDRPVENITTLPSVTSTAVSPSRKLYALTTDKATPSIRLATIDTDTPEVRTLSLPETSYTKAANPESEVFAVAAWDGSSRYLLVEHRYDDSLEWIVVDTEDVAKTKNVTAIFDIDITKPRFSQSDSHVLYALTGGDIRRIDIEASTISAPLVRNVTEFSFFDKSTLVYVTAINETTKSRSVGYRQEGASESRAIRTYSDDGVVPLHISIGKYYNQPYVAIAYDTTVDILSGPLPRSDSDDALSLTAVATMSTPAPIDFLANKTDGRFFVAQHASSYSVYDLELQKTTTTTVRGETPLQRELGWIDGYLLWSGLDGMLRFYEFDGANQNDIMPIVAGQAPALSANNRYIYAPTVDDKGVFHLSRVRLIL